jgi:hypothetical protein
MNSVKTYWEAEKRRTGENPSQTHAKEYFENKIWILLFWGGLLSKIVSLLICAWRHELGMRAHHKYTVT